ncbi:CRISPR-associated ring nuclease Crn3/Csx3 [Parafilimonas terrae]|jgi:CRISPR-associated protein Csx3|uniref:CRISPR-associated protein, Csx3 family n=1 Tax=Parafilimonas terrae TaxID=1465490 RepID=A0A1I5TL38_9BACT|nr:CRISPR-associated ring nuclease Crn3/Csx3 [Parafilimonas terrae]SFP83056.1 CRISPR-associated protein, Csx3 family [Parafilimonas terrae]
MIKFSSNPTENFSIINFVLEDDIEPFVLKTIAPPDAITEDFAHKGVILSGRGPVWLYCFLTHFYHPTKFVATYDPRLQGAVVVESHASQYKVGDIISIESSLIKSND